jgi:hypothetical protein
MGNRTVIIAGATGLVGNEILRGLLSDATVSAVGGLARRAPAIQHPKLTAHIVDFAALPTLAAADEVYLALGTTIKVAGSHAAFRAVDYEANLAVAGAALAAGARRVGLVSAIEANVNSKLFYGRVKENSRMRWRICPSRAWSLHVPPCWWGTEKSSATDPAWGGVGARALGFLIPANYKPIEAAVVARALLSAVPIASGKKILLSGAMQREAFGLG